MHIIVQILLVFMSFVLTTLGTMTVFYFKDVKNSANEMKGNLSDMSNSMSDLNAKLEKVITDQGWHKQEMDQQFKAIEQMKKELSRTKDRLHQMEGYEKAVIEIINKS